jgi:hypothetical protein
MRLDLQLKIFQNRWLICVVSEACIVEVDFSL